MYSQIVDLAMQMTLRDILSGFCMYIVFIEIGMECFSKCIL